MAVIDQDSKGSLAAMIAAPLSFTKKAPLMITSGQGLDPQVAAELVRRNVTKVYLVGTNVAPALATDIKSLLKKSAVIELTGTTRYATAAVVAGLVPGAPVLVANSDTSVISSSIGALAFHQRPILFTTAAVLPWQSARVISQKGLPVTVIGTPETVLDSQLTGLELDDQRQPAIDEVELSLLALFAAEPKNIQFIPAKFDSLLLGGAGLPTFALDASGHVTDIAKRFIADHPTFGAISVLGSSSLVNAASFNEIVALR